MATSTRKQAMPVSRAETTQDRAKRWIALAEAIYARGKHLHGLTKTSLRLMRAAALVRAQAESGPGEDGERVKLSAGNQWIVDLAARGPSNGVELGAACRPVAAGRKVMSAVALRLAAVLDIVQALDSVPDPSTRIVALRDDGARLTLEITGRWAAKNAAAAKGAVTRWNHVALRPIGAIRALAKPGAAATLVRRDESMAETGRRVFRRYVEQLLSRQYGLAYDDDMEFVHEMRVAIRRLRAAMRTFARSFVGGLKEQSKAIKGLADLLGEARDADVFVDFLSRFARKRPKPGRAALKELIDAEQDGRREVHRRLLTVCRSAGCQQFLGRLHAVLCQTTPDKELFAPTKQGQSRPAGRGAARALRRGLRRVLKYGERLDDLPGGRLHELRIACKKLRYTAELFVEIAPPPFVDLIDRMVRMQDLLGEAHDADVYEDRLEAYVEKARTSNGNARAVKAVGALRRSLDRRRSRVLGQAARVWKEFRSAGVQKPLEKLFDAARR